METKKKYIPYDRINEGAPLEAVLAMHGLRTEHTRGGMYYSPWKQDESEPSFHIDRKTNRWCLFGVDFPSGLRLSSKGFPGGRAIDLEEAITFGTIGASEHRAEAAGNIAHLAGASYEFSTAIVDPSPSGRDHGASELIVTRLSPLSYKDLLDYEASRGIISEVSRKYLFNADYDIVCADGTKFSRYAVAFPSSTQSRLFQERGEGVEQAVSLSFVYTKRSGEKVKIKKCTGSEVTLIDRNGNYMDGDFTPTSPNLLVFEGFHDFLGWMSWLNMDDWRRAEPASRLTPGICDVMVLNSVNNVGALLGHLPNYPSVGLYLDADAAGHLCAAQIIRRRLEDMLDAEVESRAREILGIPDGTASSDEIRARMDSMSGKDADRLKEFASSRRNELLSFTGEEAETVRRAVRERVETVVAQKREFILKGEDRPLTGPEAELLESVRGSAVSDVCGEGVSLDSYLASVSGDNLWDLAAAGGSRGIEREVGEILYSRCVWDKDFRKLCGVHINTDHVVGKCKDINEVQQLRFAKLYPERQRCIEEKRLRNGEIRRSAEQMRASMDRMPRAGMKVK